MLPLLHPLLHLQEGPHARRQRRPRVVQLLLCLVLDGLRIGRLCRAWAKLGRPQRIGDPLGSRTLEREDFLLGLGEKRVVVLEVFQIQIVAGWW